MHDTLVTTTPSPQSFYMMLPALSNALRIAKMTLLGKLITERSTGIALTQIEKLLLLYQFCQDEERMKKLDSNKDIDYVTSDKPGWEDGKLKHEFLYDSYLRRT